MAVTRDFIVKLLADPKELLKGFSKISSESKATLSEADERILKMQSSFNKVGLAAAASLAGITAFATKAIQAAIEDEAEQAKLAQTLRKVAGATDETVASTEDFIAAQMKSTTFTDSEMRPALAALVRGSGDLAKSQRYLGLAFDISTATGIPLTDVSDALAKAYNDNFKSLKALSPALADNIKEGQSLDQIFRELSGTFGGAATEAANTTAGQFIILKNTLAETTEAVGAALLPIVKAVLPVIQAFGRFAEENSTTIAALTVAIGVASALLVTFSIGMKLYGIATLAAAAANKIFATSLTATGIGAIVVAIALAAAALAALVIKLRQNNDELDRTRQSVTAATAAWIANSPIISAAGNRYIILTNQTKMLNSALSTTVNILDTQNRRLEGLARAYGVTSFTTGQFKAATSGAGGAVKEAVKPLEEYTKVLKSAQGASKSFVNAQRQVAASREGVASAEEALKNAQLALLKAQKAGSPGEIADAQRAVAAAERGVTRAKFGQEESIMAVRDAEAELAKIRKDPESTPDAIRRAEIALAEAKFDVLDAEDNQIQVANRLTEARRNLRIATEGLKEGDEELVGLQTTVYALQKALKDASEQHTIALENETDALNDYKDALIALGKAAELYPKVAGNIGGPGLVPVVPTPPSGGGGFGGDQRNMPDVLNVNVNSSIVNGAQVGEEIAQYLQSFTRVNGPLGNFIAV